MVRRHLRGKREVNVGPGHRRGVIATHVNPRRADNECAAATVNATTKLAVLRFLVTASPGGREMDSDANSVGRVRGRRVRRVYLSSRRVLRPGLNSHTGLGGTAGVGYGKVQGWELRD